MTYMQGKTIYYYDAVKKKEYPATILRAQPMQTLHSNSIVDLRLIYNGQCIKNVLYKYDAPNGSSYWYYGPKLRKEAA